MTDRLRPYGSDTIIVPFRIIPSGPADPEQGGAAGGARSEVEEERGEEAPTEPSGPGGWR